MVYCVETIVVGAVDSGSYTLSRFGQFRVTERNTNLYRSSWSLLCYYESFDCRLILCTRYQVHMVFDDCYTGPLQ